MRKEINEKDSKVIMQKLLDAVDAGNYDDFDWEHPEWFRKYTWTQDQEADFVVWLAKFLVKNKYTRKGTYRNQDNPTYQAKKLMFNYGWKYAE